MAWQAKLAHFSCVSRLDQAPLVVIHERDQDARRDFTDIELAGGHTLQAPSYRLTPRGFDYCPRNGPGTLLTAARLADGDTEFLVVCDPDVIFVRPLPIGPGLSAAACGYLDYADPRVRAAMQRLGLPSSALETPHGGSLCCGIPYVVPRDVAESLALAWLEAIDAFLPLRWEDGMYAFGLAVLMLGLPLSRLPLADTNFEPTAPVRAPVLHYCYGSRQWSKRRFASSRASRRVWNPPGGVEPGSVQGELYRQLAAAGRFYEDLCTQPGRRHASVLQ